MDRKLGERSLGATRREIRDFSGGGEARRGGRDESSRLTRHRGRACLISARRTRCGASGPARSVLAPLSTRPQHPAINNGGMTTTTRTMIIASLFSSDTRRKEDGNESRSKELDPSSYPFFHATREYRETRGIAVNRSILSRSKEYDATGMLSESTPIRSSRAREMDKRVDRRTLFRSIENVVGRGERRVKVVSGPLKRISP